MYEIEVKLHFPKATVLELQNSLAKIIQNWTPPITQIDTIYLSKNMTEYKIIEGTKIVRIREEQNKTDNVKQILTMKIQQETKLSSLEYETEISDSKAVSKMIEAWDFVEFVCVEKTRQKAKYGDYNFCLDTVKDLGLFLEIELLSSSKLDSKSAQDKIISFIETYNLPAYRLNDVPYDTQVFNKKSAKKAVFNKILPIKLFLTKFKLKIVAIFSHFSLKITFVVLVNCRR
ncbi:CYTH domain-containing protein [Candidatus Gracilibacteria bacterium]|nr:CYTH domain-containing protein [Candidatus Gracilibacteria bacterium]